MPIIATNVSKNQDFVVKDIPSNACMGVMTSGSREKVNYCGEVLVVGWIFSPSKMKSLI